MDGTHRDAVRRPTRSAERLAATNPSQPAPAPPTRLVARSAWRRAARGQGGPARRVARQWEGRALTAIRDGGLYREQGFKTFEAYCRERWDFTARLLLQADARIVGCRQLYTAQTSGAVSRGTSSGARAAQGTRSAGQGLGRGRGEGEAARGTAQGRCRDQRRPLTGKFARNRATTRAPRPRRRSQGRRRVASVGADGEGRREGGRKRTEPPETATPGALIGCECDA